MSQLILRNTTKNDINLGDLRYKIPAGQARDLLSASARLNPKIVEQSLKSGSIKRRLGKSLVLVKKDVQIPPVKIKMSPMDVVCFPRHCKSFITLDVDNFVDGYDVLATEDEDEFLKELEADSFIGDSALPVVRETKKKL